MLLSLENIMMDTDFDVLRYIDNFFDIPTSVYFEDSAENLDSFLTHSRENYFSNI